MKITLSDITKAFPVRGKKGADVVAVRDFDFTFPDGTLVGLLGPSGCGKSTLLNMICGLLAPTEGHIFFGDSDVTKLPPEARGVGFVFQNYALYPHLTVLQNILFPLQNLKGADKLSKEEMHSRAEEIARLVQIDGFMDRKPGELSGGQQQRVAIARALVKKPRVLLLDEPLSNLDARLRLKTREEIRRIQKETGITTVFVTHDQEEAMSISDTIVVMKDGALLQSGKPQEVYQKPQNLFVSKFLGTPPINVFDGKIKEGKLFIGDAAVLDTPDLENRDVYVAVRPEDFDLCPSGAFVCPVHRIEVMGRDTSIVFSHESADAPVLRALIRTEDIPNTGATVHFSLRRERIHLFDKATEERL
ncbi:MAG: ABC transporter ATP-binding protein [Clostridia bacterium]|nr:ABC transporter ATP-binding protein [Clostridia bacterium]